MKKSIYEQIEAEEKVKRQDRLIENWVTCIGVSLWALVFLYNKDRLNADFNAWLAEQSWWWNLWY